MTEGTGGAVGRRTLLGATALATGATLVGTRAQAAGSDVVLRPGTARQAGLLPEQLRKMLDSLRSYLGPSPKYPYFPGFTVLAARGGVIAVEEAHGKAVRFQRYDEATDSGVEFPAGQQLDAAVDTVYDLASCTKLFTSIVAVQQLERGRLELEAPAARYLPEYGRAGKEAITVRQLLTHTSGLAPDLRFFNEPDEAARRELLFREAPRDAPGTVYRYSDLNLITLQWVLERITGRPLDVLIREGITEPLGLRRTRFNPPPSWRPKIAAQEDQRKPWARVVRGLVWGEVHDENAWSFGGVAGHAGLFSTARELAVLGRALLNGGSYAGRRILSRESVELMLTDFNTAFPGDEHGLGFELYQHWFMGALATPRTAGHTGFTGTSLVLDPGSDVILVILSNSVHPNRNWRTGSAPRRDAGTHLARAVPVRPRRGGTAWFGGIGNGADASLTLPRLELPAGGGELRFDVWWDTEPGADQVRLEAAVDGGEFAPVGFRTDGAGGAGGTPHPDGTLTGWSGRRWHRAAAELPGGGAVRLRWRYVTDQLYTGRGVYLDGIRVLRGGSGRRRVLFDDSRPGDARRIELRGWAASRD